MLFKEKKRKTKNRKSEKNVRTIFNWKAKRRICKIAWTCQTHINSILRAYEIYTNPNTDFESQLRPETIENFYKIQDYYTSGVALNNIELLKNEIKNVSCFGEFLRIFNKAVELGGASVNHLTYVIQSHKPRR